jgi:nucleoside 2-deoxyribosyltransferase
VLRTDPKPRLYLASPLFTPSERAFNVHIDALLDRYFETFLPQRDGQLIPGSRLTARTYQTMCRKVFKSDVSAIARSDVLLAILDGRTIDEGVAFEIGLAFALGKTTVGFRSDARVLLPWGINPMIQSALSACVCSEDELRHWVVRYIAKRKYNSGHDRGRNRDKRSKTSGTRFEAICRSLVQAQPRNHQRRRVRGRSSH